MCNELKCPYCGVELENELSLYDEPTDFYFCPNEYCKYVYKSMHKDIWNDLINGRKCQHELKRVKDALYYALEVLDNLTEIGGVDQEIIKIENMMNRGKDESV